MAMKTLSDLMNRAEVMIRNEDPLVYDVAADCNQMVGNVSHMDWFKKTVAKEIAVTEKAYLHLNGLVQ